MTRKDKYKLAKEQVLNAVGSNWATVKALAKRMRMSPHSLRRGVSTYHSRALDELVAQGAVSRRGKKKHFYRSTGCTQKPQTIKDICDEQILKETINRIVKSKMKQELEQLLRKYQ
jgi:transposase-like protein